MTTANKFEFRGGAVNDPVIKSGKMIIFFDLITDMIQKDQL